MSDHHHQSTAERPAQVIADASNFEEDANTSPEAVEMADAEWLGEDDDLAEGDDSRADLEKRYKKRSSAGYQPVLTEAHGYPYTDFLRRRARRYAEQGFYVFPCRPTETPDGRKVKEPLVKDGFKAASIDINQIDRWWHRFPDALIGLRTGVASGVWVLDIDMKNGVDGLTELKKLEAKFGLLPDTHLVRTPSGGLHYYFKMPADGINLRNSAGKIAPGIDVRAEGGYVIAPPSMMADGTKYEAMTDSSPNESAWAPRWLIDLATSDGSEKATASIKAHGWAHRELARKCEEVAGAKEGSRNDTLNKAAFAMGGLVGQGALDRSAAFYALLEAARKCGLDDGAATKTIDSGLNAGAEKKADQPLFPDWTKAGPVKGSIDNVRAMLSWMGAKLRYNTFIERAEMSGFKDYTLLNDNAWAELWSAAHEYGFQPGKKFLADALEAIALQDKYHPVRDYFEGLQWDGTKRLDKLLIDYAGAEDNDYVRAVGAKPLIAAVRRIYEPGTKFDTMPVLEGIQGSGKSSMLRTLAVHDEWFADGLSLTDKTKEVIEQVEGCLIVEIQELKGMKHNEVENTKALLSKTHDKARKAYGRFTTNLPRQFVLFATTNPGEKGTYLKDKTGNRRFWPVRTGDEIELASLKRDRDQLWAEAVYRHKAGESLVMPRHLWDFAKAEQEKRMAEHPWFQVLDEAFDDMLGKVRVAEVWALLGKSDAGRRTHYDDIDLGEAMKKLGWEHTRLRFRDKRCYCYVRGVAPFREITVSTHPGQTPLVHYPDDLRQAPPLS